MINLETLLEKPLSKEDIKKLAYELETQPIELPFKGNLNYIRINIEHKEIYFHKRRSDGMYYLVNQGEWR